MDATVGQDYVAGIFFDSGDGPTTGLTDVLLAVTNQATGVVVSGLSALACTETPVASGYYQVTIDDSYLASPARWKLVFTSAAGERRAEGYVTIGHLQPWMRRRRELRVAIGQQLWPSRQVWLEPAAAGGSTTSFSLSRLLVGGINQYRGCWARFSTGSNRGQARPIISSTAGGSSPVAFTLTPALTAAVAAGDWVELYPEDPALLDRLIDDGWDMLAERLVRRVQEAYFDADGTTEYFQLPPDARYVYEVTAVHTQGGDESRPLNPKDWTLHPGGRLRLLTPRPAASDHYLVLPTIENPFGWRYTGGRAWPDGYTLTIKLLAAIGPPLYDDSFADLPAKPFIDLCVATGRIEQLLRDNKTPQPLLIQRQQALIRRLTPQFPPNARAVAW